MYLLFKSFLVDVEMKQSFLKPLPMEICKCQIGSWFFYMLYGCQVSITGNVLATLTASSCKFHRAIKVWGKVACSGVVGGSSKGAWLFQSCAFLQLWSPLLYPCWGSCCLLPLSDSFFMTFNRKMSTLFKSTSNALENGHIVNGGRGRSTKLEFCFQGTCFLMWGSSENSLGFTILTKTPLLYQTLNVGSVDLYPSIFLIVSFSWIAHLPVSTKIKCVQVYHYSTKTTEGLYR